MYKLEEIEEIKYDDIHGWKNAFIKIDKRRRETEWLRGRERIRFNLWGKIITSSTE